jgi:hypothetical protein
MRYGITVPAIGPFSHPKTTVEMAVEAEARATWWLKTIDPWSFVWRWEGDWPIEDMRARVRCGPPGI